MNLKKEVGKENMHEHIGLLQANQFWRVYTEGKVFEILS